MAIMEETLDGGAVATAARKLGVSTRTLHRVFRRELGVSPLEVETARRTLFAKELIVDSGLSMAEIAFAAGYGSIRRFNASFQSLFDRPPSALRRESEISGSPSDRGIVLKLPYRSPYAFMDILGFLGARAIPGVEEVQNNAWRRTFDIDGTTGFVAVKDDPKRGHLSAHVWVEKLSLLPTIKARLVRLFDTGADPAPIDERLGKDELLAADVARRPGVRLAGAWDGFELTVRAILGQQVSVAGAGTLAGRLAGRYGLLVEPPHGFDRENVRTFPDATALADASIEDVGVMPSRAQTIRDVAKLFAETPDLLSGAWATSDALTRLSNVRGIGPWTLAYIALRGAGDPDSFPQGDLGLRQAMDGNDSDEATAVWRPWRGYAAIRLWTAHADNARNRQAETAA